MQDDTPQLPLFIIAPDGVIQDLPQIVPITNRRTKDLAGQRFGRLVALGFVGRNKWNQALWLCQCDCGKHLTTLCDTLVRGRTQSCGCLRRDITIQRNFRHGLCDKPEYITWNGMKCRCENPNEKGYENYGGRGIKICKRWRYSFENFYTDMGPKPGPEYSIERINNDGDYEPGNCKWATRQEQNDNSRHNHMLEFQGKTLTMSQWANAISVSRGTLTNRLKTGWTIEEALTVPVEKNPLTLEFQGQRLTVLQWAKKTGVDVRTIRYRISRGWTIEEALTKMETKYQRR